MLASMFINDYKQRKGNPLAIALAHMKGWSYNDWRILGVTDKNKTEYLSTLQYCKLHPLNGTFSSWIDDKLTLKYILNGTDAGRYMPCYYFQIEDDSLIPLPDVDLPYRNRGMQGVVDLLKDKGYLAFKLIRGSLGAGFYKAECHDGAFTLNGRSISEAELLSTIKSLKGYIVTECLLPHPDIAKYNNNTVGCLRYIMGKRKNGQWEHVYSFMRVGTRKSNNVENYNAGGVLMPLHDGCYDHGNVIDMENICNRKILRHPDCGLRLEGRIPLWDEVLTAARVIAGNLPQLSYLGIDFCVTDKNEVKVIEINSLSSLDAFQLEDTILNRPGGAFFKERMRFS